MHAGLLLALKVASGDKTIDITAKINQTVFIADVKVSLLENLSNKDASVTKQNLITVNNIFRWECNQLSTFPTLV